MRPQDPKEFLGSALPSLLIFHETNHCGCQWVCLESATSRARQVTVSSRGFSSVERAPESVDADAPCRSSTIATTASPEYNELRCSMSIVLVRSAIPTSTKTGWFSSNVVSAERTCRSARGLPSLFGKKPRGSPLCGGSDRFVAPRRCR